jgi:hypothetical protein
MNLLDASNNVSQECNICYESVDDKNDIIRLECCNLSKSICVKCIHCLTTPICPYCRKPLQENCVPYFNEDNEISRSEPISIASAYTWEQFLEEEYIINPYLYDDSRRLRRHIRRLRYEYQQRRSRTVPQIDIRERHSRNRYRERSARRSRNELQQYSRHMTHLYNEHPEDEVFFFEMN